jgi:hypothetical protein
MVKIRQVEDDLPLDVVLVVIRAASSAAAMPNNLSAYTQGFHTNGLDERICDSALSQNPC